MNLSFRSLFVITLVALGLSSGLNSCKSKPQKPKQDKAKLQYLKYGQILKNYRNIPLDVTILQMDSFLNTFPEDVRGWTFYGRLMYDKGNVEKSIEAYKTAIRFNPRFSEGYAGVGSVYHVLNQSDSAQFYLQQAVDLKDSAAYTFLNLSMLFQQENETEKSLFFAQKAFDRADSSAAVYSGLSYVYNLQKNKAKSEEMFLLAVKSGLNDTASFRQVLNGQLPVYTFFKNNGF